MRPGQRGSGRDASGRFARREEAPPERPFFPKSAPRRESGERDSFRGPQGRSEGGRGYQDRPSFRQEQPRWEEAPSRPARRFDAPPQRSTSSAGLDKLDHRTAGHDRPDQRAAGFDRPARVRQPRAEALPAPRGEKPVRAARATDSVDEVAASEYVCGIHAVEALLETSPRRVQRLLLLRGNNDERLHKLQEAAEGHRIPCQQIDSRYLEQRAPGKKHQGVVAVCNERQYADWGVLHSDLRRQAQKGLAPVVLVASAIEDPRNLGAIARTCVGLDVAALILPMKGGCGLTALADETSAGALSVLPVARPNDLEKTLKELSEDGFAIIGLDAEGDDIRTVDFSGPVVLVAGGEDRGIPPHMRRPCDRVASIPMSSRLQSYNASVAAALALWEIHRGR